MYTSMPRIHAQSIFFWNKSLFLKIIKPKRQPNHYHNRSFRLSYFPNNAQLDTLFLSEILARLTSSAGFSKIFTSNWLVIISSRQEKHEENVNYTSIKSLKKLWAVNNTLVRISKQ